MSRCRCLTTRRFSKPKTRSSGHKNLSKKNAKALFAAHHITVKKSLRPTLCK
jgi:hypothetical protein